MISTEELKAILNAIYGTLSATNEINIKIKYFSPITPIEKIPVGDWVDLRAAETVSYKKGDYVFIHLGVGMILPEGYEAHIEPRSSTLRKKGIVSPTGIIENTYCGEEDEWIFQGYAISDGCISFDERICQFRIYKTAMDNVTFTTVDSLSTVSRGGLGSTGDY